MTKQLVDEYLSTVTRLTSLADQYVSGVNLSRPYLFLDPLYLKRKTHDPLVGCVYLTGFAFKTDNHLCRRFYEHLVLHLLRGFVSSRKERQRLLYLVVAREDEVGAFLDWDIDMERLLRLMTAEVYKREEIQKITDLLRSFLGCFTRLRVAPVRHEADIIDTIVESPFRMNVFAHVLYEEIAQSVSEILPLAKDLRSLFVKYYA